MFKVLLYILSFPSLVYLRWDFCRQFLRVFLFLLVVYNLTALIGEFQGWNLPLGHPGYFLSSGRYWPDSLDFDNLTESVINVPVFDAVPLAMAGGFLLLILNWFYAAFRDNYLGVLTRANIPLLFSGASWFTQPFRLLMLSARLHRLVIEPLLLLGIGGFLWGQGQSALGALVIVNGVFYFLASLMDLPHYRDHYLKEQKKEHPLKVRKSESEQSIQSNTVDVTRKREGVAPIIEVCAVKAFEMPPVGRIKERLPEEQRRLINADP